jgi:hypothetical protein
MLPSLPTVAMQLWQPAVSSFDPMTKNWLSR